MPDLSGTASGQSDATALVLVGDEVGDWAIIQTVRRALSESPSTRLVAQLHECLDKRERQIRLAAVRRQRGRRPGGANWTFNQWKSVREACERHYQQHLGRSPKPVEVCVYCGVDARTERRYRRQLYGVPGAWKVLEPTE